MMTTTAFVLLLFVFTSDGRDIATTTAEFSDKVACENAGREYVRELAGRFPAAQVAYLCMPKASAEGAKQ